MVISTNELAALTVVLLATGVLFYANSTRRAPLPPGPRGLPLLGNLFQFDVMRPYPQYLKWAQKYGPVFSVKLGGQRIIVLNSSEAADELLATRSKLYSSRESPHVGFDLVSDQQRMLFMPYGREWKIARKNVHSLLGPGPSKQMGKTQDLESRVMLHDLLCHGETSITEEFVEGPRGEVPERHWFSIVRRYTTSVVMMLVYGRRIHRIVGNPELHKVYDLMSNFTHVSQPGRYMVDALPVLRWLPDMLAPWRAEGRKMHKREMDFWGKLFSDSRTAFLNGTGLNGFVQSYLRARTEAGLEDLPGNGATEDAAGWMRDKLITYTAVTIVEAGSDTTSTGVFSFVLLMLSNPDALQRAKEEMDAVVGSSRMPDWEDEDRLPWLTACIKETLRRAPPAPLGIPHKVDEDDVYNGYLIPKGSTVIGNIWAIHMDPVRYPDPTAFKPERFYNPDGKLNWASGPDAHNRDHYIFGWGRRFCSGKYLAEASMFIVLSRLIWGFDFYAASDPQTGKARLPDVSDVDTFTDGLVTAPKIYPVGFKPRSEKHAEMIKASYRDVQNDWQSMGLAGDER
uniref:Cytochrome P450 monooxygenase 69 n=1 Tax=Postia placenta (strain ATCC 44394 / Madison 698-R) TaxID=561896 RepID=CY069_POSPM|nr:RecName: Full=Cytochrome P450 monooxygenase 69 [Postia placenta Mad-698-R]BAK09414.1 cytochrome P450 [Postia placenta]